MKHTAAIIALLLGATPMAAAAPFCVKVTGVPAQCLYVDPAACQREADRAGGRCVTNEREFERPIAALPYCLARAGNVMSCVYPAYADCETDARRLGGTCVAARLPPRPGPVKEPGTDPFAITRP
ncbi:hypothetical protein IP70_14175 [alpha proteobacterium AAP38]|uniref:hypothetical protein n=1 Tax=Niveispirillum sp. TaxID=1917217 RepID=UPI0006B88C5C|nr:hypothetical protein IP70_14175 [alpha proteobacterium AAP38]